MDKISEQSKNGLLLVSHPKVFEAMEAALGDVGCRITDDIDAVSKVDLVVIDSFYLKAGMAEYVKMKNDAALTLLVLRENEPPGVQGRLIDKIDDAIVLEPQTCRQEITYKTPSLNLRKKGFPPDGISNGCFLY